MTASMLDDSAQDILKRCVNFHKVSAENLKYIDTSYQRQIKMDS